MIKQTGLTVFRKAKELKVGNHINFFFPNKRKIDRGVIYKIEHDGYGSMHLHVEEMFNRETGDRGIIDLKSDDHIETYIYSRPVPKPTCEPA